MPALPLMPKVKSERSYISNFLNQQNTCTTLLSKSSNTITHPKEKRQQLTLHIPNHWIQWVKNLILTANQNFQKKKSSNQGRILRRRRGVSRFTYIFSISFSGRLDPSGMLANFQPPPPPRFPWCPNFSTVKVHPSEGRRRLYLWHFTSPAICTQPKPHHSKRSTSKNQQHTGQRSKAVEKETK